MRQEKNHSKSLVWLRRDLRTNDHRAWSEAELSSKETCVVFVFDSNILRHLDPDDRRVTFLYDSLLEVQEKLKKAGSQLIVRYGDPKIEIPLVAKELKVDAVFCNRDYEKYAKERDTFVENDLKKNKIEFYTFKDHVVFECDEVKTQGGDYFRVFTPYSKAWRAKLTKETFQEAKVSLKNLISSHELKKVNQDLSLKKAGFERNPPFIKAGMSGALAQIQDFKKRVSHYEEKRNFPAIHNGTSLLSPHLRFGTISIRELVRLTPGKDKGTQVWHSELIWRDFFQMLLAAFPKVATESFQLKYKNLPWPGTKKDFQAWVEGQTGYPLIDAAMRHFAKTGWMHNRLRMIVASFLTKDLLCHWQWGESYFAKQLLDFDLAANNGGWQWASSVGCDAQPYFRIFNPILQSERFDPEGEFIRSEVPELKKIPNKFIHAPWKASKGELLHWGVELGKNYPHPLVDHAQQKEKILKIFKDHQS